MEIGSLPKWQNVNLFFSSLCSFRESKHLNYSVWIVSSFIRRSSFRVTWFASDVILLVIDLLTEERAANICSHPSIVYCCGHMQAPLWCCPFLIVKAFLRWLAVLQHRHARAHTHILVFELPWISYKGQGVRGRDKNWKRGEEKREEGIETERWRGRVSNHALVFSPLPGSFHPC